MPKKRPLLLMLTLCLSLALLVPASAQEAPAHPPMPDRAQLVKALVEKVVDGDTIWCRVEEDGVEVTRETGITGG